MTIKSLFAVLLSTFLVLSFARPGNADVTTGLVAYYPFDGNANDFSGKGRNGTGYNGVAYEPGIKGQAASFNGINAYIKARSDGLPNAERSVSLWFFANTIKMPRPVLLGYGGGTGCGTSWFMMLDPAPSPPFYISGHCHSYDIWAPYYKQPIGDWYHLVITTSPEGTKFYVNGENVDSNPYFVNNTAVLPGRDLTIGVDVWYQGYGPYTDRNVGYFDGKIDELRIYNRALSKDEVLELYRKGTASLTITPNVGGDTGNVSVRINGSGFAYGAAVKLVKSGELDIIGNPVTVETNGVTIEATFDLKGKALGQWDLVVQNPDSTILKLEKGFTIEKGRDGQLRVDIVGLNIIRPNRPQTYWIVCENTGNVNRYGHTVMLGATPNSIKVKRLFDLPFSLIPEWEGLESIDSSLLKFKDETAISAIIPEIGAGKSIFFPVELTATSNIGFHLETFTNQGSFANIAIDTSNTNYVTDTSCDFDPHDIDALSRALKLANDVIFNGNPLYLFGACAGAATEYGNYLNKEIDNPDSPLHEWKWAPVKNVCHQANILISPSQNGERRYYIINHFPFLTLFPVKFFPVAPGLEHWETCNSTGKTSSRLFCPAQSLFVDPGFWFYSGDGVFPPLEKLGKSTVSLLQSSDSNDGGMCPSWEGGGTSDVAIVQSFDPNDKIGSGVGNEHYAAGHQALKYAITFENIETATAPAQEVMIADQIDITKLDLSTLSLGPMKFGNRLMVPTSGQSSYATDVDFRPDKNLVVKITGSLNPSTGLLAWRFTSIDPATGNPPEDPLAGFLPPNVNPPEGTGSVLFTIMPKSSLTTGSEIRNKAEIVFDANAPIVTPEWFNTIDNSKPTSKVLPLAATQIAKDFQVQWTGSDEGSGIKDYSIFVSEDGGPFTSWINASPATSATFSGQRGKTYAFYSIARDNTGNLEDAHPTPDASTTIVSCAADRSAQVSVTRGGYRLNRTTGRYVQTVTIKNMGTSAIDGPVSMVLADLSSNVTLFNSTGKTACAEPIGSSYININVGADDVLSPAESVAITLEFANPNNQGITYTTRVLDGTGEH